MPLDHITSDVELLSHLCSFLWMIDVSSLALADDGIYSDCLTFMWVLNRHHPHHHDDDDDDDDDDDNDDDVKLGCW